MASACVWIVKMLIAATIVSLCLGEDDTWPNFSCHPFNVTSSHVNANSYRHMSWNSCLEPYQKWNGRCPKACVLLRSNVLGRKSKGGPLLFNTDAFIYALKRELGYGEKDTPLPPAMEIINKVRSELEQCKIQYPEFAQFDLKGHSCEPWGNLTTCIDKAVGC